MVNWEQVPCNAKISLAIFNIHEIAEEKTTNNQSNLQGDVSCQLSKSL